MNVEYKKELEKNYLIIKPDMPEDYFSVQMLLENQIEGLLRFERRVFNGEVEYYYDISGKHSLESQTKNELLGEKTVRTLLQSLYCVEENLYSFFLREGRLLIEASYVYMDERGFYFVYVPLAEKRKEEEHIEFIQELQELIDYEEEGAMQLTYRLYQMLKDSEKGILQILEEVLTKRFEQAEDSIEDFASEEQLYFQEEKEEEIRPDFYTASLFSVSFLVSLCYLLIIFFSKEEMNVTGIIACVFVVASLIGILVAFADIDIKSKK